MNKSFRQRYQQQQNIESQLADYWGYSLMIAPMDIKEKRILQKQYPVVARINPRMIEREISKTERIRQVENQILQIQNQRMLRQLRESRQQGESQQSEIIKLTQDMIEDYNNIIMHRHIQRPATQGKTYPQQIKKGKVKLLQLIDAKKSMLLRADLSQQIEISKEIVKLYHEINYVDFNYSSLSLKNNRSAAIQPPISHHTMNNYQSQAFQQLEEFAMANQDNKFWSLKISNSDQKFKEIVKKFRKLSDVGGQTQAQMIKKLKEVQLQRSQKINKKKQIVFSRNQNLRSPIQLKKVKNSLNIVNSLFMKNTENALYRQMENKIKSNVQALQLWKNKVNELSRNSRPKKKGERTKSNNLIMEQEPLLLQDNIKLMRNSMVMSTIDSKMHEHKPLNGQSMVNQKLEEKHKERIFALLLRKKNNKFNKLRGTKIVVKYNSQEEAKSMLKGNNRYSQTNASPQPQQKTSLPSKNKSATIDPNRKCQLEISHKKDDDNYWRMCKNEKINLLLKRR